MSGQIVFLTLFLGLFSGVQPIDLHVDGPVKSIRILLGNRDLTTLKQPPWHAMIDLGPDLRPSELVAVGYDEQGEEIARASQVINLPRPMADFEIVLHSDSRQIPTAVELRWRHLTNAQPKRATITIDGTPLKVDAQFHGRLPRLDSLIPHVLSGEMRFEDGFVARRELVIEGVRSYAVGSQLTPVLVTETESRKPAGYDCFSNDGVPVHTAAVEKTGVRVIIVQDPDASHTAAVLGQRQWDARHVAALEADTFQRILWPLTRRFAVAQQPTTMLFEGTVDIAASGRGLLWILMRSYDDRSRFAERRRFADAVAVAAVSAVRDGQRRAVVLVLSDQQDASQYDPQTVRRYLMAVGVPLFVWSVEPRPHLAASWGEVEDISTIRKLLEATERLRRKLDTQRVAWVATDPLTALRLDVKPDCGLAPVARLTP